MVGNDRDDARGKHVFFFNLVSQGGLSRQMVEYICSYFAIIDQADKFIVKNIESTTRESAEI